MLQVINRRPGDKLKCLAENRKLVKYHQIFDYDHSLNQQFSFLLLLLLLLHVIVFLHTHTHTHKLI